MSNGDLRGFVAPFKTRFTLFMVKLPTIALSSCELGWRLILIPPVQVNLLGQVWVLREFLPAMIKMDRSASPSVFSFPTWADNDPGLDSHHSPHPHGDPGVGSLEHFPQGQHNLHVRPPRTCWSSLHVRTSLLCRLRADPFRCNSTNRLKFELAP